MALCDLKPVRTYDEASGSTYYIGDVFGVSPFGSDDPVVYSWDMMKSVSEDKKNITFDCGSRKYVLPKKCFTAHNDYFRAIALIETAQGNYGFHYNHLKRILPIKSSYLQCLPEKDVLTGKGMIDEGETAAAFIMLMNLKLVKVLWLVAILMALIIFGVLHLIFGVSRNNILYFIPISAAGGGIITLLVYLSCYAFAHRKYQSIAGGDPASKEEITFVISHYGFSACESCICDYQDLIPWNRLDYFVETNKMFIFYKDNAAVFYMPKKAFDKKNLSSVADLIALKLEQR